MVYAAQFSADNNWYRARVDAINGDSVAVTYIDYGNTENLLAEKLRLLSIDMTSMKSAVSIPFSFSEKDGGTYVFVFCKDSFQEIVSLMKYVILQKSLLQHNWF